MNNKSDVKKFFIPKNFFEQLVQMLLKRSLRRDYNIVSTLHKRYYFPHSFITFLMQYYELMGKAFIQLKGNLT